MTYDEFKTGLFIKYHLVYLKSTPFIKFNIYHWDVSAVFEKAIILKSDAERVLSKIKNRNMVKALCLMAQGYMQWEVGAILGKSEGAIKQYVVRIKKELERLNDEYSRNKERD